jgi:hypothetical protein
MAVKILYPHNYRRVIAHFQADANDNNVMQFSTQLIACVFAMEEACCQREGMP